MSAIIKFEFLDITEEESDWLEGMGFTPKIERCIVISGLSQTIQANWGSLPPIDNYLKEEYQKYEVDFKSYSSRDMEMEEDFYGTQSSHFVENRIVVLKGGKRRIGRMTEAIEIIVKKLGGRIKIEDKDV